MHRCLVKKVRTAKRKRLCRTFLHSLLLPYKLEFIDIRRYNIIHFSPIYKKMLELADVSSLPESDDKREKNIETDGLRKGKDKWDIRSFKASCAFIQAEIFSVFQHRKLLRHSEKAS